MRYECEDNFSKYSRRLCFPRRLQIQIAKYEAKRWLITFGVGLNLTAYQTEYIIKYSHNIR